MKCEACGYEEKDGTSNLGNNFPVLTELFTTYGDNKDVYCCPECGALKIDIQRERPND